MVRDQVEYKRDLNDEQAKGPTLVMDIDMSLDDDEPLQLPTLAQMEEKLRLYRFSKENK